VKYLYTHHPSPITNYPSAIISHLSPLTSHLSPLTSHLSPITIMFSFKIQLFALVSGLIFVFIVIICLIFIGIDKTRQDLLELNKNYLAQITLKLDFSLWEDSFSTILEKNMFSGYENEKKIVFLNAYFLKLLEGEFSDFPGVDFGFYDIKLKSIVGCPPPLGPYIPEHLTREKSDTCKDPEDAKLKANILGDLAGQSLLQGQDIFVSKYMDGKVFLFYIHPLERKNELIGISWAIMEFRDFYKPFRINFEISFVFMLVAIFIALAMGNNLRKRVACIQDGLQRLKFDLSYRFAVEKGEFGQIAMGINEMTETLSKVKSYTELILEETGEGVSVFDNDRKVLFFNKSASMLLDLNRIDVIGRYYGDIFKDDNDLLRESIEDTYKGNNRNILKAIYSLNSGKEIILSISTFCLELNERQAVVMFLRDLTDTERMERRLRQTDKLAALGKLVAGVAHEIKNPIAAIRANIQLWEKRLDKAKPSRESLNMVIDEVDRLNGIVEKWLIFARDKVSSREICQLNTIIERSLELMKVEIKRRKIDLVYELAKNLPSVYVSPQEIEQVIINLIQNALDVLGEETTLTLKSSSVNDGLKVKLEIIDTGPGIHIDIQGKVFDPFFTTKEEGTGIGLAVCYDIITSHGGTIDFETQLGEGTNFYILLPAV